MAEKEPWQQRYLSAPKTVPAQHFRNVFAILIYPIFSLLLFYSSFAVQPEPSVPGAFTPAFSGPGARIHWVEVGKIFKIRIWFDSLFPQKLLVWGNTVLSSCCERTAPNYRGAWRAVEVRETVQGNNLWPA